VNAAVDDSVCSEGSSNLFSIILVVYKALLIVFGIAKAVSTWKVKSDISDAKHFALAIYNITVVGGIVYAMVVFLSFGASAMVILKAIGLFFCSTLSATIVIVPKLLLVYRVEPMIDLHNRRIPGNTHGGVASESFDNIPQNTNKNTLRMSTMKLAPGHSVSNIIMITKGPGEQEGDNRSEGRQNGVVAALVAVKDIVVSPMTIIEY